MPFDIETSHASPTGATLNLYVRHARGTGRGVVQINHGLAEHAARYARFADFLGGARLPRLRARPSRPWRTTAPDAPPRQFGDAGRRRQGDRRRRRHPRPDRQRASRPAGHRLRPFDGRADRAELRAAAFRAACMPRRSGTPISRPACSAASAQAILAWESFRLGSDMPSRMLPKLTFQAWGEADARPPHRVRLAVARPGRGRQIRRRPALRLGCVGLDVAATCSASSSTAPTTAISRPSARTCRSISSAARRIPATDGGKAVDASRRAHAREWAFRIWFQRIYAETRHESLNEVNRDIIMEDFAAWAGQRR